MDSKYDSLKRESYIRRIVVLSILPWIIIAVYLLTREADSPINLWYLVLPLIITAIIILALYFLRKVFLGSLIAVDLDFDTVYQLEKRKSKKSIYNLKLLSNLYFYDGNFKTAIEKCDEILGLSKNIKHKYAANNQKILSLFLDEQFDEIPALISEQKILGIKLDKIFSETVLYYNCIEEYLKGSFIDAAKTIEEILQDEKIDIQAQKKIVAYYLMRLCYLKANDKEQVLKCENQIFAIDNKKKTFFAKSLNNDNTG